MSRELQENSEARSMQPAVIEARAWMPSQQDMAAFWESLKLAGSANFREQDMYGQGFTFVNVESLYGASGGATKGDNKTAQAGIIAGVGATGVEPMSESKLEQGDRSTATQSGIAALNTPDAQDVRNASPKLVEAIKAANPNQNDGSLQSWANKTPAERLAYAEKTGQDGSFEITERKPSGKEVVIAARQMFAEVETKSQSAAKTQELAEVDSRPIRDYGYEVSQVADKQVIKSGIEYQVGKPPEVTEQSLLAKIGTLPLDQQAQVIGAGIKAFSGEMSHQQFRIGVGAITGLGDGVVGLAQGAENLGKTIIGVAQFSRDLVENPPAAKETAGKACDSVSKLLTSGVKVYSAAEGYLESVGAATNVGDYGKALRDVACLGQQINSRWEAMTPEEKTRLTTKLAVENLGALAVGFSVGKIAKSEKITETLEAMGTEVSAMGAGSKEKAGQFISRLLDKLMPEPVGVTDGYTMPIPRESLRNEVNVLMSKADDLGDSGRLVGKSVDATGKTLGFSKDSGIEITTATGKLPDSIWIKGWSIRGFEGEVEMGNSGILAKNFPTIDDAGFRNGVFTSMKTIDLNAPTYQNLEKLQKRLNNCLEKVIDWNGQRNPWGGIAVSPSSIKERILNVGIPNGSMTADQVKVFEQLGKLAQQHGIKVKVTVIE